MLTEALRAEVDAFVAGFADETLPDGRRRVSAVTMSDLDSSPALPPARPARSANISSARPATSSMSRPASVNA